MKVEKKPGSNSYILGYFLLELIYCRNLAIWILFFLKFGEFGPFFPHEKSFVFGRNHIFQVDFMRKFANKIFLKQLLVITSLPLTTNSQFQFYGWGWKKS
jgi:hypothetical protein